METKDIYNMSDAEVEKQLADVNAKLQNMQDSDNENQLQQEPEKNVEYLATEENVENEQHSETHLDDVEPTEASEQLESQHDDEETHKEKLTKAVNSERKKAKQYERELRETKRQLEEMQQQIASIREKENSYKTQSEEQELQKLKQENPTEYTERRIRQLEDKIAERDEQLAKTQEQQRNQQAFQEIVNKYNEDAAEYREEVPDFMTAYEYLRTNRYQQYYNNAIAQGYSEQQAQIGAQNALQQEELQIVTKAYSDGENPAERIYKIAKHFGYQRQAKQMSNTISPKEKANMRKKAHQTSGSIMGSGGKTKMHYSAENLSEITDPDEFLAAFDAVYNPNPGF